MKLGQVTLLTKPGSARLQEGLMIGAVRHMAIAAIFPNRSVLPEKGPALFGVAFIAGVVHGGGCQQGRTGAAVGLVTIATDLQTFSHGMDGATQKIRSLGTVTVKAQVRLGFAGGDGVAGIVHLMTVAARQLFKLVNAACPVVANVAAMTVEANGILIHRVFVVIGKGDWRWRTLAVRASGHMGRTGAVTALALMRSFGKGRVWVGYPGMGRFQNTRRGDEAIGAMALQTALRTAAGVGRRVLGIVIALIRAFGLGKSKSRVRQRY